MNAVSGQIDERGYRLVRELPGTALENAERLLVNLQDILHPLALEVERTRLDEYGLEDRDHPVPPVLLWVADECPEGVAIESTVSETRRIKGASAAAALATLESGKAAVRRIQLLASAVRLVNGEQLSLSPASHLVVPRLKRAKENWVAGPLDGEGFRRQPPVTWELKQFGQICELRTAVHWSPWSEPGTWRSQFDEAMGSAKA